MANRNVYDMDKQKVALVLSMGGARGIAHIGVIEELLRHNFEITSIAGSSMGAMVGAMYASGKMEECKYVCCTVRMCGLHGLHTWAVQPAHVNYRKTAASNRLLSSQYRLSSYKVCILMPLNGYSHLMLH